MCQCNDQSCGSKGDCGSKQSCCCSSCGCGCNSKNQGCCSTKSCNDSQVSKFLELADQAWLEVLKEKIKEHIQKNNSKNMEDLAALISQANNERWKKKIDQKNCCGCFEEKIKNFFEQSCSTHK